MVALKTVVASKSTHKADIKADIGVLVKMFHTVYVCTAKHMSVLPYLHVVLDHT